VIPLSESAQIVAGLALFAGFVVAFVAGLVRSR